MDATKPVALCSWRVAVTILVVVQSLTILLILWRAETSRVLCLPPPVAVTPAAPSVARASINGPYQSLHSPEAPSHPVRIVVGQDSTIDDWEGALQQVGLISKPADVSAVVVDHSAGATGDAPLPALTAHAWVSAGYIAANASRRLSAREQVRVLDHAELWERLAYESDSAGDYVVVLEDIRALDGDYLDAINAFVAQLPSSWELCFLPAIAKSDELTLTQDLDLIAASNGGRIGAAYALSRAGAQKLARIALPAADTVDAMLGLVAGRSKPLAAQWKSSIKVKVAKRKAEPAKKSAKVKVPKATKATRGNKEDTE